MLNRRTLTTAAMLVAAFALGGALVAQTSAPAVSRVVVVETANPGAYAAAIAEGQEILTGLGSSAKIHVWQARYAGEDAGTVVSSIEWPSMAAMAADDALMQGSEDMSAWIASLAGSRTIVSDSLYQEITQ
jgi:hypothetical protein